MYCITYILSLVMIVIINLQVIMFGYADRMLAVVHLAIDIAC